MSAALGLAACTGGSGDSGSDGPPGPVGPPGGGTPPVTVASATSLYARINGVRVPEDGRPVVDVYIADEAGRPITGLPAGNIRFVLSRLEPGYNGKPGTWHAITRRTESFPGTPAPTPSDRVTGTGAVNQGYTETATEGTWVDNKDGIFTYTFRKDVRADAGIPYDASLAHRVGLEIRTSSNGFLPADLPANNALYTFIPATGMRLERSGRDIVDNATCNKCHDKLAFHGGARTDVQYCAMCHESYSFDAQSGNSLDLRVMIHKVHSGMDLPSVSAGGFYGIFGFGNTFSDFSGIEFTQDTRHCAACHVDSSAQLPQADAWRRVVDQASCGSCHDDVNFATGTAHGGVAATDDTCTACHGPNSSVADGSLTAVNAHAIPEQVAGTRFRFEVLKVENSTPGERPKVTIRVVDPAHANAPYDIRATDGPFQNAAASLRVDLAWSTRPDFTNTGSGSATATTGSPAQPVTIDFKTGGVADAAFPGSFSATSATPLPAAATGSGYAALEGRAGVDVTGDGIAERIPVPSAGLSFAITDPVPVPYRKIVDVARCNDCHGQLSLHGGARTDSIELCATCHNPNATDVVRRVAGSDCTSKAGDDDQSIDFKYMIHAIHAGPLANYTVCGFGNVAHDFSQVTYPGKLNDCEGCHLPGTYYPAGTALALATTFDANDRSTPLGDVAVTAGAAGCVACHGGSDARLHMELNGSEFDALKGADSGTPGAPLETCSTCHGADKTWSVRQMHRVDQFLFN